MSDGPEKRGPRPDPSAETRTDRPIDTEAISGACAPEPRAADFVEGATLLHFRVVSRLGRGGMGVVYKAFDTRLRRFVALKVLARDQASDRNVERRLFREARRAAGLSHPGIAAVYEVHDRHDPPFFVMEFVDGDNLRGRLTRGQLGIRESLEIALQLASALGHAHMAGLVHRDVKPENTAVTRDGIVKLLDFGIAKQIDDEPPTGPAVMDSVAQTAEGEIIGTPEYMAPEQALGRAIDARADVFALGVVLYEMLSGVRPFHRSTGMETAIAIVRDAPPRLRASSGAEVPVRLASLVQRCLAKDPSERFATANEVAEAIRRIEREVHDASRSLGWRRIAALILGALLLVAVSLLFFSRKRQSTPAPSPPTARTQSVVNRDSRWRTSPLSTAGLELIFQELAVSHHGQRIAIPSGQSISIYDSAGMLIERAELPSSEALVGGLWFLEGDEALVVNEIVNGKTDTWRVPLDGTIPRKLRTLFAIPRAMSVASTGHKVAIADDEAIWVGSDSMDKMQRAVSFSHTDAPNFLAWSPDARRIAAIGSGSRLTKIDVYGADGSGKSEIFTNDERNWSYQGPTIVWTSNDTISYLRDDSSDGSTRLITVLVEDRNAGPVEVARLEGQGYSIVGSSDGKVIVRRIQGTDGTSLGLLGSNTVVLNTKVGANRSRDNMRQLLGWFGGGGFAFAFRNESQWFVEFEHERSPEAARWMGVPFSSLPTIIYDGFATWTQTEDVDHCALLAQHRERTQTTLTASPAIECGSRVTCAYGRLGACVIAEKHLGSEELSVFDVDRGARGRHLYSSESKIEYWNVGSDGRVIDIQQNGHFRNVDVRTGRVTEFSISSMEPYFGVSLPDRSLLVVGAAPAGYALGKVGTDGATSLLWTSSDLWLGLLAVVPDGSAVGIQTITMKGELSVLSRDTSPP